MNLRFTINQPLYDRFFQETLEHNHQNEYLTQMMKADAYVITTDKAECVGIIIYSIGNEEVYIDRIIVSEESKRMGYGKKIVNWIKVFCLLFGRKIRIHSTLRSEGFWRRMNFRATGKVVSDANDKEFVWTDRAATKSRRNFPNEDDKENASPQRKRRRLNLQNDEL